MSGDAPAPPEVPCGKGGGPGIVLLILACVACAYGPSLPNGFVFDDQKLVVENEAIRSLANVPRLFLGAFRYEPVFARDFWIDPGYRPTRMASYALDVWMYGGVKAWGFRLTNIALHALNAVLVYFLLRRLLRGRGHGDLAAGFGALLFALHPVQTEAVVYVSGRRDVLFAAFYLCALLILLRHLEEPRAFRPLVAWPLFVLALFSKEMAVTLPLLLALIDAVLRGPREVLRRRWLYACLLLTAAVYSAAIVYSKNPGSIRGESVEYMGGSLGTSLLTMGRVLWHYVALVLWPATLCADYSFDAFPASAGLLTPWTTLLGLAGIGAAALGVRHLLRSGRRVEALGVLIFAVALAPVFQVIPHPEPIAERYLYLPLVGIVLVACALLAELHARARAASVAVACLLLVAAGVRAAVRVPDWRSDDTLFASVVRDYPRCARAELAVAKGLLDPRRKDGARPREALDALDRGLEVVEGESWEVRRGGIRVTALFLRGRARIDVGLLDEAIEDLRAVLSERTSEGERVADLPGFAHVRLTLAAALKQARHLEAGEAEYRAALEQVDRFLADPPRGAEAEIAIREGERHRREALVQLGDLAFARGRPEEGLPFLRQAAGDIVSDDNAYAHIALGRGLMAAGELAQTQRVFERVATAPGVAGREHAYLRLAMVRELVGDLDGADVALREALKLAPRYVEAAKKLAEIGIQRASSKRDEPKEPTGRRTPRQRAEAFLEAASKLLRTDQRARARKALTSAVVIDPGWSEPRIRRARLLLEMGQPGAAVADLVLVRWISMPSWPVFVAPAPMDTSFVILLGQALWGAGAPVTAEACLRKRAGELSVEEDPTGVARLRFTLASLLDEAGRSGDAALEYEATLMIEPGYAAAVAALAALRGRQGDVAEAHRLWRSYLDLAPLGPRATEARAALAAPSHAPPDGP